LSAVLSIFALSVCDRLREMLDCNADANKQLLCFALQNECPLCSVIAGVKEDTRVREVSHFLLLSWVTVVQAARRACVVTSTQKSVVQVYSSLLNLLRRDLHVVGPRASLCFVVGFGEVGGRESGMCRASQKAVLQLLRWPGAV